MNLTAPDLFKATFKTSQGTVVIEVHRDWAPLAADRFYSLVKNRFFDNCRIFRVVPDFIAQWGIHGQPKIAEMWTGANIPDEPRNETNARGTVAFAKANTPHSRATQVFINLKDNNDKANPSSLDNQDFAPFGKVIEGMSVVDKWYQGYGDHSNLDQGRLAREGNAYLSSAFPMLDYIVRATILEE